MCPTPIIGIAQQRRTTSPAFNPPLPPLSPAGIREPSDYRLRNPRPNWRAGYVFQVPNQQHNRTCSASVHGPLRPRRGSRKQARAARARAQSHRSAIGLLHPPGSSQKTAAIRQDRATAAPPRDGLVVEAKEECGAPDCGRPRLAQSLCSLHYQRMRKDRNPSVRRRANGARAKRLGSASPFSCLWQGCGLPGARDSSGRRTRRCPAHVGLSMNEGYVRVSRGGRTTAEHILVMEEHLGRSLEAHENIHHGPGGRADNRLENLELWRTSQPAGQRVSDMLKYVREYHGTDEMDYFVQHHRSDLLRRLHESAPTPTTLAGSSRAA